MAGRGSNRVTKEKKLNILWIMLYWYPYEGPLQPVYGAIIKDLTAKGHNVTIVASFPHFRKGRTETWDQYRGKLFQKTLWEGAKLVRTYVYAPVFNQDKPGLLYRALNFISFNISSLMAGIFMTGKTHLVFAPSSPPLTNGICGGIISLFKRCPLIYNVQDIYPDMAEKSGIVKKGFRLWFMKRLEKIVYRLSDNVLLLSEGMRKNVIGKGVPPEKTEVISNFFDASELKPRQQDTPFSRQWNPRGRFLAVYGGNAGIPHGAEVILDAAQHLKEYRDILFAFVGRGEYRSALEHTAKERGLDNVLFVPPRPNAVLEDVRAGWAAASVSLVTYKKGLAGDSLPTKLIASMFLQRPVIAAADEGSDTAEVIKKAGCGIVVPPEDGQAFANAIYSLYQDNALRQQMAEAGRQYALEHYKHDVILRKYETLFLNLVYGAAIR